MFAEQVVFSTGVKFRFESPAPIEVCHNIDNPDFQVRSKGEIKVFRDGRDCGTYMSSTYRMGRYSPNGPISCAADETLMFIGPDSFDDRDDKILCMADTLLFRHLGIAAPEHCALAGIQIEIHNGAIFDDDGRVVRKAGKSSIIVKCNTDSQVIVDGIIHRPGNCCLRGNLE
jgi:hypothetical protein